jgi:putative ATP-dependent endonuclease of the OLD family
MVIDQPGKSPYLRIRLEASWEPSSTSLQGEIDAMQYIIKVGEGEPENDQSKKEFPKFMYNLFQVIYVPALRKTSDQLRFASGSILHRLLKTVEYSDSFKQQYKEVTEAMNALFESLPSFKAIQQTLQNIWSRFHKDSRYKDAKMNFGSGELDEILKKLEVNFSPAPGQHRKFSVDDLGDGYRSLFYITLVCTLLEIEDSLPVETEIDGRPRPLLTLLEVEEPENHIAPQILGRVIKILVSIAQKSNTQVFITSHTPAIIKRLDPETIFHFRIAEKGTTEVNHIELPAKTDEAYKYVKEAVQNYPEIYFAKLVVIGEGDSEEVLFNHLMKVMDTDFDDNIISFAPLGHRFVSHIWRLLAKIKIPHITLLDLDLERYGGGWGRVKYALEELVIAGYDRSTILAVHGGGVLSEAVLKDMHKWDYTQSNMISLQAWIKRLETFNVYYSYALDLDFLMLTTYKSFYTAESSYPKGGGPRVPDKILNPQEHEIYRKAAIAATLKDVNVEGQLYSDEEKDLMIWYKYHFLARGKPVTHLQVLSQIDDKSMKENLPAVFKNIFIKIDEILSQ